MARTKQTPTSGTIRRPKSIIPIPEGSSQSTIEKKKNVAKKSISVPAQNHAFDK
jgi:hypothetical protein